MILSWNCQGAKSSLFIDTIRFFIQKYQLHVVVLLEPRISGIQADRTISRIGLPNSFRVEATGFSGGIWILWDDVWPVQIIEPHSQYIHCRVQDSLTSHFFFTAVYGHPVPSCHSRLWPRLQSLCDAMTAAWVLLGDFNSLASSSERLGSSVDRSGVCGAFVTWIHATSLLDLGYVGPDFTWRRGTLHERLDRGLCNAAWRLRFPEATISHLVRYQSDHRPLLLNLSSLVPNTSERPFRFMRAWLAHDGYRAFVEENWQRSGDLMTSISHLTDKLREWNRFVFGNIFWKKNNLLARLAGIQKTLERHPSRSLLRLEAKLTKELDETLLHEETLWFQKSRDDWIEGGTVTLLIITYVLFVAVRGIGLRCCRIRMVLGLMIR